ncbi:MAG: trypsin-like peptidase domain-containing protein [Planctomycetes bacterium]|nr:trypsin-like peptidase domain-containing protein [Planctomycetota bacterium]
MKKDHMPKKSLILICLLLINASICAQSVFDQAPSATLENSVVMIRSVAQGFDFITPWKQMSMGQGTGSGFVIEGNRILTNAHNVSNNKYIEVKKQNIAKRYPAKVEFVAHDCDLAIIKVLDEIFFDSTAPLQIGGIPKVNTAVNTYGFPLGGKQVSVTKGVVSRIQMDVYAHTRADSHLVIQTDAAINPGNSGGPVLQDGKVVGVAFQGLSIAENIGYMIPTTVIDHFLKDIDDGTYDGFGSVGFIFNLSLHNKSYAEYLKVPFAQQGVIITDVLINSTVEDVLKKNDVLIKVDDYPIDNDAMIKIYGLTLHMSEAIEQKQLGETVELQFYRDGQLKNATATVALNRTVLAYWRLFDEPPKYYVYAGLTFVPLSRNFLENWGSEWITDIPFYLRYLFHNSTQLNTDRERKEYIVLSEVLPDDVNAYCGRYKNKVVESINGKTIRSAQDVQTAFETNSGKFCTIEFMGSSTALILDNEKAKQRHPEILKKYNVPAQTNMETNL